ncbi:Aste57867_9600 [Aphanomyces stellatus]|uniref:Aste57867_9600 protein n=1 Tax=Aphanomyces stellatus TaxID=120398 RepID=A0A485KN76_9STRA|nr:hypothetical protein As57867_009562 [Aphanomyces stellatus]VFT86479.1 Aste57867_9600 [Aphanomyces stellatus]
MKKRGLKPGGAEGQESAPKKAKSDDSVSSPKPKQQATTAASSSSVLRDLLLNVRKGQLDPVVKTLREFHAAVDADATACPLLRAYIDISPQSEPLVDLWGSALWGEDKTRQIIPITMELLTSVFQNLKQHKPSVAEAVALTVLKTKIELISKQLSWSDKPLIEYATLMLCTEMIQVHPRVAREFVRVFDFTAKSFEKLCVRRHKVFDVTEAAPPRRISVRHAFVAFALALTTSVDQHVHRFALKTDGIAHALFKSIEEDTFEDANAVLSTLADTVLNGTDTRAKHHVFTGYAVSQLLKLLDADDERTVQLAQQYFDALFFAPGALYRVSQVATLAAKSSSSTSTLVPTTDEIDTSSDAVSGGGSTTAMKVVSKLLSTFDLMATMTHSTREALLFRFLREYPGLILVVFQSFHAVMEPRPSFKWFSAASFVLKALNLPLTPLEPLLAHPATLALPGMHEALVKLVLPLGLQKKELSKAVQHADLLVVHTSLNLISVVMRRVAFVEAFVPDVEKSLRSILPPAELILTLCTKFRADSTDAKKAAVYGKALSVLQLYFHHLPLVMKETKFDVSKLIVPTQDTLFLQGALLHLLESVESTRLGWIVSGDATKFRLLLNHCLSPHAIISTLAYRVVRRVLAALQIFGVAVPEANAPHEIDAWLHPLARSPESVSFLDQLVRGVTANPFAFVNQHTSPMTQALVAYFNADDVFPFQVKVQDPVLVSAYATRVLATLVPLYPFSWLSAMDSHVVKDPQRLVASFTTNASALFETPIQSSPAKSSSTKETALRQAIDSLEAIPGSFVLSDDLLTAIWQEKRSFNSVYSYVQTHRSRSIFASPALQKALGNKSAPKATKKFLDAAPVDLVLSSLYSPFVLATGVVPSIETKQLLTYLKSATLDTKTVQLASVQLTHGLCVYLERLNQGLAPHATYTAAVTQSAKALHFLLTWATGKSSDAFWTIMWQHHAKLVESPHVSTNAALSQWLVLPYALGSFRAPSTLLEPSNSPLAVVTARHLSPERLHDALESILHTTHYNAPLALHLIAASKHATLARPALFEKIFRLWQAQPATSSETADAKRWITHYVQQHDMAATSVSRELFDLCWAQLQADPADALNISLLQELIRRCPVSRHEFAQHTRSAQSLGGLIQLSAAYLHSLPLEPTCVEWIETIVLPSFVEETLASDDVAPSSANVMHAFVQVVDTLYSHTKMNAQLDDWLPTLLKESQPLSASKLQLLLAAAQRSDLTRFASKIVGFGLGQLMRQDFATESASLDALAAFTLDTLERYAAKKVPASTVQSFLVHLAANSDWYFRDTILDVVAKLAVVFPTLDFAPLLAQLMTKFEHMAENESFLKAFGVLLKKTESSVAAVDMDFLRLVLTKYGATLSTNDVLLKAILEVIQESHDDLSLESVGYCFGKANHLATSELEQHWLLEEIDATTMKHSIEYFPHTRPFKGPFECKHAQTVYDPAYFLPLIAHPLSTSHIPDRQLLQSGILGFAICGLSAEDDDIRAYAYGIVAVAHESMSATARTFEFNERRQVHLLLETLKNGIDTPHARLPFLITVFVNDAITSLLKPGHFMFPLVNAFLLARSALDVNDVPMFYALFNSSSTTFRPERSWLLHLVKRGVKLDVDVELLQRRHVYSILIGFFDSPLADTYTQEFVLEILARSVVTASGNFILIHKMGLLQWLEFVAIKYEAQFTKQILTIVSDAIENYYLSEKKSDKYAPNTIAQLRQLCRTLVHQRRRHALSSPTADLLRAVLIKYFTFCTTTVADGDASVWFALDLLEATVENCDDEVFLAHVSSYLAHIPSASRAFQFTHDTHARWAAVASWARTRAASTDNLTLKLALPETIQHLSHAAPVFHAALL